MAIEGNGSRSSATAETLNNYKLCTRREKPNKVPTLQAYFCKVAWNVIISKPGGHHLTDCSDCKIRSHQRPLSPAMSSYSTMPLAPIPTA